jgi:Ino eighty subunit 2
VSLNEGSKSKKQPLNETELALRREEIARKRKNLSEKKLEDEKAETINRLLKKQSRPKNKRTTALDDRSPLPSASGSRTPKTKMKGNIQEEGEEAEGDDEEDEPMDVVEAPLEEVKPVMYRWVSSLKVVPSSTGNEDRQVQMGITFSIPEAFVPPPVDEEESSIELEKLQAARGPGLCAVEGCGQQRKYRLPRDWTIGACNSTHLRIVANQV